MLLAVAPSGRALPTATKTRLRSVKSIPEHMLPEAAIPDASTRDLLSILRGKYGAGKNVPRRLLGINKTLATAAQQNAASKKKIVPSLLPVNDGDPKDAETLPELLAAIDRLPMSAGGAFEQATSREVLVQFMRPGEAIENAQRRLNAAFVSVLDTSARLFQRASRDLVAQSDVALLITRLERTLLKLALRDG